MTNYQIKLTPVDTFFFGGEKHDENLEANYFVESLPYPQQTALLGILRYFLLAKNPNVFNGKSIIDKTEAEKLIGRSSFDYDKPPADYGKISSLSPLYFIHKNEPYFFAPFDFGFDLSTDFKLSKHNKEKNKTENYNAKDHYYNVASQKLINAKDEMKELSSITSDVVQVGNEKAGKGEPRDKKFYKQFSKRLSEGWCFCVDVELADGSGIMDNDAVFLPFGGEKSYFKLEVKKQPKAIFAMPQKYRRDVSYIFCQTDCFVDASVLNEADFAVNSYVSFRNLQSKVQDTKIYSGLSATDKNQLKRSNRFNLLQRGSVLYFQNKSQLESASTKFIKTNCETIGFNQIITNT